VSLHFPREVRGNELLNKKECNTMKNQIKKMDLFKEAPCAYEMQWSEVMDPGVPNSRQYFQECRIESEPCSFLTEKEQVAMEKAIDARKCGPDCPCFVPVKPRVCERHGVEYVEEYECDYCEAEMEAAIDAAERMIEYPPHNARYTR